MVRGPYVGIPQLVNEMTKRTVNVGSLFRQLNNAPGSCRGFFVLSSGAGRRRGSFRVPRSSVAGVTRGGAMRPFVSDILPGLK